MSTQKVGKSGLALILLLSVISVGCDPSQTCDGFEVNTTADKDGACTQGDCALREAVLAANGCTNTPVIVMPAGTYKLGLAVANPKNPDDSGKLGDLDIKASMKIVGGGQSSTIVDANFIDRAFDVHSGAVSIEGITIRNGWNPRHGGAVRLKPAITLTVTDSIFSNNVVNSDSVWGGAIFVDGGTLYVRNVEFNGNRSTYGGGAVYNLKGAMKFFDSRFYQNKSWAGGAVGYSSSDVPDTETSLIENCSFEENEAHYEHTGGLPLGAGAGGALFLAGGRTLIKSSHFSANKGEDYAGALYARDAIVTIMDSIFENNEADSGGAIASFALVDLQASIVRNNRARAGFGGGIQTSGTLYLKQSSVVSNEAVTVYPDGELPYGGGGGGISSVRQVEVSQSTIAQNQSRIGGGLYLLAGTTLLFNSTVSSNVASESGGGVYVNSNGNLYSKNSTITGNTAPQGAGITIWWHVAAPALAFLNHSIIANNSDPVTGSATQCFDGKALAPGSTGPAVSSYGHNIVSDGSCSVTEATDMSNTNPLLDVLADNGGVGQTHLPLPGSPAINNGANGTSDYATEPLCRTLDQRGVARPKTGGFDGGLRCDIGAVELQGSGE